MLIGFEKNFIFLSTLKTASTSIELALRPHAEICLIESRFGKHMTVRQIKQNLGWLFAEKPMAEFFIFGVISDPVDFVLSLYNSHKSEHFKSQPSLYTGNMDFDDFIALWGIRHRDQLIPQHLRFMDGSGKIGANYVITFNQLDKGLADVLARLGITLPKALPRANQSVGATTRADLSSIQLTWIADKFSSDTAFIEKYCNRLIDSFSITPDLT